MNAFQVVVIQPKHLEVYLQISQAVVNKAHTVCQLSLGLPTSQSLLDDPVLQQQKLEGIRMSCCHLHAFTNTALLALHLSANL